MKRILFVLCLAAVPAAVACGGSDPQPTTPTNGGVGTPPTAPTPPTTGGTAQPLDPNAAQVATAALGMLATSEAPGMAKEGPTVAGMFQEGQSLEAPFTFQPGKCYTLLAAGAGPQAVEVEMMYTTPVPGFAPSIGTAGGSGPQASIGGKGSCLKPLSPFPAQAKFVVRAKKGAGVAAAQLYVK